MSETQPQSEIDELRQQVEAYRQRELADLKSALAVARQEAEHYRGEAHRNADIGRKIAMESQREITELRAKLDALTKADTNARRFAASRG